MVTSLFKRSGGYFAGLTASRIMTTVVFILLARHFAPSIFGQAVLYVTLLTVGTYFADVGLVQWYQKVAESEDRKILFHRVLSARLYTLLLEIGTFVIFFALVPTFSSFIQTLFFINL